MQHVDKRLALKAPTTQSAPARQKRGGPAFSTIAKKTPPKIRFSSFEIGKKRGVADGVQQQVGAQQQADGALQQWLRAGNGQQPLYEEARKYLLRGPPYRGTHARDTKESIKELGATWMKNPLKLDEVHNDVAFGWFGTTSEKVLVDLIRMPQITQKRRKYHSPPPWKACACDEPIEESVPQWMPLEVPEKSHEMIVVLILQHDNHVRSLLESQAKAAAAASDSKERDRQNTQRMNDIPADTVADIAEIARRFNIVWNNEMSADASRCTALGPHSGISSCRRAMRALMYDICSSDEIVSGMYAKERRAHNVVLRKKVVDEYGVDSSQVDVGSASTGCYMFGNGKGMLAVPTDRQWETIRQAFQNAEYARIATGQTLSKCTKVCDTWCTSCTSLVTEQFGDCSCLNVNWQWCDSCRSAFNTDQDCGCSNPELWSRQQHKCKTASQLMEYSGAMAPYNSTDEQPDEQTDEQRDEQTANESTANEQDTKETLEHLWRL